MIHVVSRWHWWDDHECRGEQFQWSGVYSKQTGGDWEDY